MDKIVYLLYKSVVPSYLTKIWTPIDRYPSRKENYVLKVKNNKDEYAVMKICDKKGNNSKSIFEHLPRTCDYILYPMGTYESLDENREIVMYPYCENGDMFDFISKHSWIPESVTRLWIYQIIEGIKFLHDNFVIHRDIKSENILFDKDWNCLITDFDFSIIVPSAEKIYLKEKAGTKLFMPPEVFHRGEYSFKTDMWLIGELIASLITGVNIHKPYKYILDLRPFDQKYANKAFKDNDNDILKLGRYRYFDPYNPLKNGVLTNQLLQIINKLLNNESDERPSIDEILLDPWFKIVFRPIVMTHSGPIVSFIELFKFNKSKVEKKY